MELHSHVYEWYEREKLDKGIPYPIQSLNVEFPNLKTKDDPENRFLYKYPSGEWIKPEDLGISKEELQKGVDSCVSIVFCGCSLVLELFQGVTEFQSCKIGS